MSDPTYPDRSIEGKGFLTEARAEFHSSLLVKILTRNEEGVASNADKGSNVSVQLANSILERLGPATTIAKLPGQTAGADFEQTCANFISLCFDKLSRLRPGRFTVSKGGVISNYYQYAHLDELDQISRQNRELATALGSDYLIKPDVVIIKAPETDVVINEAEKLVDEHSALHSALRQRNTNMATLHASVSCKWTLRSDRAQNARSEALKPSSKQKGTTASRGRHYW